MKTASVIIIILAIMLMPFSAVACALLTSAVPRVGSEVRGPVDEVKLNFSMPVDIRHSEITVENDAGQNQVRGQPLLNPADNSQLLIKTAALAAGDYKVVWKILADCGDMEPGSYEFTVVR